MLSQQYAEENEAGVAEITVAVRSRVIMMTNA